MSMSLNLTGSGLLQFIIANRETILEESEESILFDIREMMEMQLTPGERLLCFELIWDEHWDGIGIENEKFVDTEDEFTGLPDTMFWVQEDGALRGGADDLAELRQTISSCLDEFTEALRGEISLEQQG